MAKEIKSPMEFWEDFTLRPNGDVLELWDENNSELVATYDPSTGEWSLEGNSLTNLFAILGSDQSSPPDNPSPGDFYMDDGTNTEDGYAGLRQYTNGSWEDVGAGGGGSNAFSFFMG